MNDSLAKRKEGKNQSEEYKYLATFLFLFFPRIGTGKDILLFICGYNFIILHK